MHSPLQHTATAAHRQGMAARVVALLVSTIAFVVAFGVWAPAAGADEGDATLTLQMTYTAQGKTTPIQGTTAAVYQVAALDDNINDYTLLEPFASLEVDFNEQLDAEDVIALAADAAEIVEKDNIEATASATSDAEGNAAFGALPYGIYLVEQTGAQGDAEGYHDLTPFLVGVPELAESGIVYDVVCLPKVTPKDIVPKDPSESTKSDDKSSSSSHSKSSTTPKSSATPKSVQSTGLARTGDATDLGVLVVCLVTGLIAFFAGRAARRGMRGSDA